MRKTLLLTTLLLGVLLTGCGTKETEANEVKTVVEETVIEETIIEETVIEEVRTCKWSEEYFEEQLNIAIVDLEMTWEENGIPSEECKDDVVELLMSVEYDDSFEYGYDLDSLQRNYVNILVEYGVLPEVCMNHNFDELESIEGLEEL